MEYKDIELTHEDLPDELLQGIIKENPDTFVDSGGKIVTSSQLREILNGYCCGHKDLLSDTNRSIKSKKIWVKKDFEEYIRVGRRFHNEEKGFSESDIERINKNSSGWGESVDDFSRDDLIQPDKNLNQESKLSLDFFVGGGVLFLLALVIIIIYKLKTRK